MKKPVHQMLKALLMSRDLKTGLICYDILNGKITAEKALYLITTTDTLDPDSQKTLEHLKVHLDLSFFMFVLQGNIAEARLNASEENKAALDNLIALQMLQGLLACENRNTAQIAYEVLAGLETIESLKVRTIDPFMKAVLNGDFKTAQNEASLEQRTALTLNSKPNLAFTLNTIENVHRLNYIMLDQKLTLDDIINTSIKSFYEIIRADEHAELRGEELPQNYYI